MAHELQEADPHNVVRLTLYKQDDEPRPAEAYENAAALLRQWQRESVLLREPLPCVYVCEQTFSHRGKQVTRRGLLCATLLEEPESGNVLRHEKTTTGPKLDRFKLMQACRSNLSPVFGIFADEQGAARDLLSRMRQGLPIAEYTGTEGVRNRIWRITDRSQLQCLAGLLTDEVLVIADGHHRYETAIVYRRRHRSAEGPPGSAPEDFIPALCVPATDPALHIRPTHRLVKAPGGFRLQVLLAAMDRHFRSEEYEAASVDAIEQLVSSWRAGDRRFACFAPGGRLIEFTPRQQEADSEDEWSELPVNILHHAILPQILNLALDKQDDPDRVMLKAEPESIYWDVESGHYDLAFLLSPLSPQALYNACRRGRLFPPKTTYFHPKIESGLAIYPFGEGSHLPELLKP